MILVDAANVIGSRPTGWWKDRPGAARHLVERLMEAVRSGRIPEPVVVVLEGAARRGFEAGTYRALRVVHAPASGDDTLVNLARDAVDPVVAVTADRDLRARLEALGASVVGPGWLLDRLADP